jgi:hypothetical protein
MMEKLHKGSHILFKITPHSKVKVSLCKEGLKVEGKGLYRGLGHALF